MKLKALGTILFGVALFGCGSGSSSDDVKAPESATKGGNVVAAPPGLKTGADAAGGSGAATAPE